MTVEVRESSTDALMMRRIIATAETPDGEEIEVFTSMVGDAILIERDKTRYMITAEALIHAVLDGEAQ